MLRKGEFADVRLSVVVEIGREMMLQLVWYEGVDKLYIFEAGF